MQCMTQKEFEMMCFNLTAEVISELQYALTHTGNNWFAGIAKQQGEANCGKDEYRLYWMETVLRHQHLERKENQK